MLAAISGKGNPESADNEKKSRYYAYATVRSRCITT